jgi:hypothetical protein
VPGWLLGLFLVAPLGAQGPLGPSTATRAMHIDATGVMRWDDDFTEVRLFGANYVIHTASDFRAAGSVGGDRKAMIDEDMAQFARMGWDGLRLTFWGDWESSDSLGNLLQTDHLDLLDYLIARARQRGIYMLLSPIQLYNANWPDALQDTTDPGFGRRYPRDRMGIDPAAIAAQRTYLRQILEHVNPYTGVALKDEPAILMIELVNEPVHHPEDLAGSIAYIDTLAEAVRSTGARQPIFYNVSQDFRIGEAIARSTAEGITFGWYPTGLNSGHELAGNHLRSTDDFPDMRRPDLAHLPRIVYEFDAPDTRSPMMYPAMARTFRSVGTQFAAMFAYDMLQTASRNLGWQTHYLNLVYTPRKAMGAILAAEAMRRLPRMATYGDYPDNTTFGPFHLFPEADRAELLALDAFMHSGPTASQPPDPAALERIVGIGSSPVVRHGGTGIYFLDKLGDGAWRLEVNPDAVPVADPFEPPRLDKVVTRALFRSYPMTVALPDLGPRFTLTPLSGDGTLQQADSGRVTVRPGVYLLRAAGATGPLPLPARVGRVGMREWHAARRDTVPLVVVPLAAAEALAGRDVPLRMRVVDDRQPDSVVVFVRPLAGGSARRVAAVPSAAYEWTAMVPAADVRSGPWQWQASVYLDGMALTHPGARAGHPWDWNFPDARGWPLDIVDAATPLRLFSAAEDAGALAFTRIGDGGRTGRFRLDIAPATGATVVRVETPDAQALTHGDYTASLQVGDRLASRRGITPSAVVIRARGLVPEQVLHLSLMERDGTTWTVPVVLDTAWTERRIPLVSLGRGRGVSLPQGFPGQWNYWVRPAADRRTITFVHSRTGSRIEPPPRVAEVERLLLSLRSEGSAPGAGVELEWVDLRFEDAAGAQP